MRRQFAVIGVGRFGGSVAKTLIEMGNEVLVIDRDPERVQAFASLATHAVEADSTDEKALKALGIRNFDVVVVSIGDDIQASIMTTLILKEMNVSKIVVKARNDLHGKVLYKIGADKVIYPERDMGVRVAHSLVSPNILDFIELSEDYSIMEISAGKTFSGKSLKELNFRARYGCNVIAIKSGDRMNVSPSAHDVIQLGDILVVLGHNRDLKKLEEED
jgi:trk system potassium uptake protein